MDTDADTNVQVNKTGTGVETGEGVQNTRKRQASAEPGEPGDTRSEEGKPSTSTAAQPPKATTTTTNNPTPPKRRRGFGAAGALFAKSFQQATRDSKAPKSDGTKRREEIEARTQTRIRAESTKAREVDEQTHKLKKLKSDLELKEDALRIREDSVNTQVRVLRDSAEFLLAPYFKNQLIQPSLDLARNGTKGVPLLLYRPTRLIKSQVEEIESQKVETEQRIADMLSQFDADKEKSLKELFDVKKSIEYVHDALDGFERDERASRPNKGVEEDETMKKSEDETEKRSEDETMKKTEDVDTWEMNTD
ncbi:hypothetical protein E3P81_00734 [Wallemia ichthyophaga]|nr:hypothetical protein E3P98_00557 [Wallemia ichthyophaga]TIA93765.1 hypothetical protein E3P97_00735 [Wallemia ichthyophaga]TIB06684.1 hypothetical protein E3P96_00140 [Wallemia ichthyophaga]TIB34988.1 hypothetical protein E3P85_00688 [Wallemia ichthyophaga]TIB49594.1 hypothetical protein E3P82_00732 [Wallemia ichthyophaga]